LAAIETRETQSIADKAYRQIQKAIDAGKEVSEDTRRQVVEKIAEMEGAPQFAQEALRFIGKRFDQMGTDEVEMSTEKVAQNQQYADNILALDGDAMLKAMESTDLPPSVRLQITQSPQYKQALEDRKQRDQVQFFNDMVAGTGIK